MIATSAGRWTSRVWLLLGFVFLYLPIIALVVFSFTDSPVPNVWAGFSLRWYHKLAGDAEIRDALFLSLKIAAASATGGVFLGTLAAFTLERLPRFRGRTVFAGMVSAPLVMPEVIVGLSLLLMLVSSQRLLGFPERGLVTIWLGHLLVGMAYATVVVSARLRDLNPQYEEAAQDLGARPLQVFLLVTLPMIFESLLAAWLLTFTLSLDDVVMSAFLSGPGSTTLPLVIFSRARLGLDPTVNALAAVVIAVVAVFVVASSYLIAARERRRYREGPGRDPRSAAPIIEGFASSRRLPDSTPRSMPIYAYKCGACGFAKDVLQKMSDAPLSECPACGASAFSKQVTAAGFQLKGSGWYVTDFRDGGGKKEGAKADKGDKAVEGGKGADSSGAASGSDAAPAKSTESAGAPAAGPAPAPAPAAAPAAPKKD